MEFVQQSALSAASWSKHDDVSDFWVLNLLEYNGVCQFADEMDGSVELKYNEDYFIDPFVMTIFL